MASKAYFILAILLLSTFMSSFSFARELQASKSSLGGGPLDPNSPVFPGRRGKPYRRPCKRAYRCRPPAPQRKG